MTNAGSISSASTYTHSLSLSSSIKRERPSEKSILNDCARQARVDTAVATGDEWYPFQTSTFTTLSLSLYDSVKSSQEESTIMKLIICFLISRFADTQPISWPLQKATRLRFFSAFFIRFDFVG